jgi:cation:H+ antiporter
MSSTALLIGGLVGLTIGAELMVRGAAALALRLGLTPLVIGLTVIAFGTSAPELVVSVIASQRGSGAIAVGNVIGSNLCNLAFILGTCALIHPLTASHQVIRREVPVMIGATALGVALLWDHSISMVEGFILLLLLIGLITHTVRQARRETDQTYDHREKKMPTVLLASILTLVGLGLLMYGSHLFVEGAVTIARNFGWSEKLIGLTIVAIGTSLPELATSVVAVVKGENDVAIGNVVGSCLFNILGILGVTGLLGGVDVPELSFVDLGILLGVTIAVLPLVKSGGQLSRLEGAGLLLTYVGYTGWLILS